MGYGALDFVPAVNNTIESYGTSLSLEGEQEAIAVGDRDRPLSSPCWRNAKKLVQLTRASL